MNHAQICEELFDLSLRFDHLIYLAAAMGDTYSLPEPLENLLDEEEYQRLAELFDIPELAKVEDGKLDSEQISEWLVELGRFGFLVQAATPVRRYTSPNCATFSWGYYHTQWFYAETLEEVISKAKQWAEAQDKADLDKYLKESGQTAEGGGA